ASIVSEDRTFVGMNFGERSLMVTGILSIETHREPVIAFGRNVVIGTSAADGLRRGNPDTVDAESTTAAITTGMFAGRSARDQRSRSFVSSARLSAGPYPASINTVNGAA